MERQIDESRDPENVEHGERRQKNPGEQQEDGFTSNRNRRSVEILAGAEQ